MNKNIKAILFDLDDTLIHTNRIFTKEINRVKRLVAKEGNVEYDAVAKLIEKSIVDNYSIAKVNPDNVWPMTLNTLKESYSLNKSTIDKCQKIFEDMYKIVPTLKKDTIRLLQKCNDEKITLGLVTHASKSWTYFKLDSLDLRKYFKYIHIVDIDRFKTHIDWSDAIKEMSLNKETTCIIGDNVKGDIIAGYEAGIKQLIWVKKEDGWSVYNSGELPKCAIKTENLTEVYNILFN